MNSTARILIGLFLLLALVSCRKNEDGNNGDKPTPAQDVTETDSAFREMSLEEVKALVDEGDLAAMTELSYRLYMGEGIEKDLAESFALVKRAAEGGHAKAMYNTGVMYHYGEAVPKDMKAAFSWYLQAAEKEYPEAMYAVGVMYGQGIDIEQDAAKSLSWIRKAAEKGSGDGAFYMAYVYRTGTGGVPQDEAEGLKWLHIAAEKGVPKAWSELGIHFHGLGDYPQAFQWTQKAAEAGDAHAMYNLAVMHQHGQGTEEDLETSFSWYLKSAEKGHGEAARYTALMYNLGEGTERNVPEALKWFHAAADRGIKIVYNSIASIYYNGEGTEPDYVKARDWSLKAAENGDVNAYMTLYCIYRFGGHGVEKNDQESLKWQQLADPHFGAEMVKQFRMTLVRDNPDYLYDLAVWLWDRGDREEGLGEMEYAARAGSEKAKAWLKDKGH